MPKPATNNTPPYVGQKAIMAALGPKLRLSNVDYDNRITNAAAPFWNETDHHTMVIESDEHIDSIVAFAKAETEIADHPFAKTYDSGKTYSNKSAGSVAVFKGILEHYKVKHHNGQIEAPTDGDVAADRENALRDVERHPESYRLGLEEVLGGESKTGKRVPPSTQLYWNATRNIFENLGQGADKYAEAIVQAQNEAAPLVEEVQKYHKPIMDRLEEVLKADKNASFPSIEDAIKHLDENLYPALNKLYETQGFEEKAREALPHLAVYNALGDFVEERKKDDTLTLSAFLDSRVSIVQERTEQAAQYNQGIKDQGDHVMADVDGKPNQKYSDTLAAAKAKDDETAEAINGQLNTLSNLYKELGYSDIVATTQAAQKIGTYLDTNDLKQADTFLQKELRVLNQEIDKQAEGLQAIGYNPQTYEYVGPVIEKDDPPGDKKLGFKDAKSTLIAAGALAAVGGYLGLTSGEKKQPEEGVENDTPKKSSWFTPRKIIAALLIGGATFLAFKASKGVDLGKMTGGLLGGKKTEITR